MPETIIRGTLGSKQTKVSIYYSQHTLLKSLQLKGLQKLINYVTKNLKIKVHLLQITATVMQAVVLLDIKMQ